jgi:hypothetical protein
MGETANNDSKRPLAWGSLSPESRLLVYKAVSALIPIEIDIREYPGRVDL